MALWIGTSGWQYRDWRGRFYPQKLAQKAWLEWYAERFDTVEVNNTFYRLPERSTFEQWRDRLPEGFRCVTKISRYLSHIRRLREPQEAVERFVDRLAGLGPRRGPALLQLDPRFAVDVDRLRDFLAVWPRHLEVAFEPRHESWFTDDVFAMLRDADVPLVWSDRLHELRAPLERTASWGYVRLHEGRGDPGRPPGPCYPDDVLATWTERVAAAHAPDDDVYVFFNNDPTGCAVADAVTFADLSRRVGLIPTRVPAPGDVAYSYLTPRHGTRTPA